MRESTCEAGLNPGIADDETGQCHKQAARTVRTELLQSVFAAIRR